MGSVVEAVASSTPGPAVGLVDGATATCRCCAAASAGDAGGEVGDGKRGVGVAAGGADAAPKREVRAAAVGELTSGADGACEGVGTLLPAVATGALLPAVVGAVALVAGAALAAGVATGFAGAGTLSLVGGGGGGGEAAGGTVPAAGDSEKRSVRARAPTAAGGVEAGGGVGLAAGGGGGVGAAKPGATGAGDAADVEGAGRAVAGEAGAGEGARVGAGLGAVAWEGAGAAVAAVVGVPKRLLRAPALSEEAGVAGTAGTVCEVGARAGSDVGAGAEAADGEGTLPPKRTSSEAGAVAAAAVLVAAVADPAPKRESSAPAGMAEGVAAVAVGGAAAGAGGRAAGDGAGAPPKSASRLAAAEVFVLGTDVASDKTVAGPALTPVLPPAGSAISPWAGAFAPEAASPAAAPSLAGVGLSVSSLGAVSPVCGGGALKRVNKAFFVAVRPALTECVATDGAAVERALAVAGGAACTVPSSRSKMVGPSKQVERERKHASTPAVLISRGSQAAHRWPIRAVTVPFPDACLGDPPLAASPYLSSPWPTPEGGQFARR